MADTRQRTTLGNRFRFLVRFLGVTGLVACAVGAVLLYAVLRDGLWELFSVERLQAVGQGASGEFVQRAALVALGGLAVAVLVLAFELLTGLFLGSGRRTVAGTVATAGVVAAIALLVIVNLYSFTHYARHDATRDKRFTLPPALAAELAKLRGTAPTTIVVHQTHDFGPLMPTRDSFTKATEAVVTAKVLDLVDQFREFGPQFKVVVLDKEAFEYRRELEALTKDAPELKAAIQAAPENSIFFHANKRVQRLAFSEFLQLDRTASDTPDETRANLVLIPQGTDTFARRILAVQERRPKVAVCVVHELLTTAADDPKNRFSLAGLRKSLTDHGFDVVDIVLKKGWASARSISDLKPAADTREESKLERLEGELDDAEGEVMSSRAEVQQLEIIDALAKSVRGKPWDARKATYQRFIRGNLTEDREPALLAQIERGLTRAREELREATRKKEEAEKKVAEALKDERPLQGRRVSDVAAKFAQQLADVDLLIVPRYTTEDAMKGPGVEASLHALSKEQAKVAKEFMKQGKPVLACLGPITPQVNPQPGEPPEEFDRRFAAEFATAADEFEKMLSERGVELGRTVVLYEGETQALTRGGQFGGSPSEVPPVLFADPAERYESVAPNPIAASLLLSGRTGEKSLDLKLRALRPITLAPGWQAKQPFAAEIAFTTSDSWNTLLPYPQLDRTGRPVRVPKYTPTALDDPKKGTRDEERKGPLPVAVAIENKIPAAWVNEEYDRQAFAAAALTRLDGLGAVALTLAADRLDRPTQRTVVFGSGTMFNAQKLDPPEERLLLHTVNWLTRREDRLPRAATDVNAPWSYPRVAMSDSTRVLWQLGTLVGLPALVAYVGLLVMMRRRMR